MPSVTSSAVLSRVMTIVAIVDIDNWIAFAAAVGREPRSIVTRGLRGAPMASRGQPQATEVLEIPEDEEGAK
jgi:hypothetical protein